MIGILIIVSSYSNAAAVSAIGSVIVISISTTGFYFSRRDALSPGISHFALLADRFCITSILLGDYLPTIFESDSP